jgi:hypothetical protein
MNRIVPIILLSLFALIFSGCGDSTEELVFTNGQGGGTGTLVFNFVQAQTTTVPVGTQELHFDFYDISGNLLDSQARFYSGQVVFNGVSTAVVRVDVTAFTQQGYPVLFGTGVVAVIPGIDVVATLQTSPITLDAITVVPDPVAVTGAGFQLVFQGTFSNGAIVPLDPADAQYSGNDTGVVTVNSSGFLTPVTSGNTTLTASFTINGNTTDITFDVNTVVVILPANAGTQINDIGAGTCNIGESNVSRNIAIDGDGGIHTVFVNQGDDSINYTGSTDGGTTFSASAQIGTNGPGEPIIAAGNGGFVYIAYVSTTPDVRFARSTDGGQTWSSPQTIAGFSAGDLSMTTFGNDVYISVDIDGPPNLGGVDFVRSIDNGASFETPLDDILPGLAFQDVVVDPTNGDVYVAGDDPTVMYVRSTDRGASFSSTILPGNPDLFFSDFATTAVSTIIGSQTDGGAVLSVIDLLTDTSVPGGQTTASQDLNRAVAVDIDNTVFLTGSDGANSFYETADANGNITSANPVVMGAGQTPDVAGHPFVRNVGMLYNNAGNIFYFAP